jgi:hypothetical protein
LATGCSRVLTDESQIQIIENFANVRSEVVVLYAGARTG